MRREPAALTLDATVLAGDYCVGCGMCASVEPDRFGVGLDARGLEVASARSSAPASPGRAEQVCPFSDSGRSEDEIAASRFAELPHHASVGRWHDVFACRVVDDGFRAAGSSGGVVSWLCAELLATGTVDGIAHVVPRSATDGDPRLATYRVSRSIDDVRAGGSSRYHPANVAGALAEIRQVPGRYAVVALPCAAKALRLAMEIDDVLRERVVVVVGLVCGHLKSLAFAQSLAWQAGVHPAELARFDFRVKDPTRPANRYAVRATATDGSEHVAPVAELFGGDWGLGLFKPKACEYCDDVFAEVADVTIGDAWLPAFVGDPEGTSLVVVRDPGIGALLGRAAERGRLWTQPVSVADAERSQSSGLKHRREGLAYRLHRRDAAGEWRPRKRVAPRSLRLQRRLRAKYDSREELSARSHGAFVEALALGDPEHLARLLAEPVARYRRSTRVPLSRRVVARSGATVRRITAVPRTRRGGGTERRP